MRPRLTLALDSLHQEQPHVALLLLLLLLPMHLRAVDWFRGLRDVLVLLGMEEVTGPRLRTSAAAVVVVLRTITHNSQDYVTWSLAAIRGCYIYGEAGCVFKRALSFRKKAAWHACKCIAGAMVEEISSFVVVQVVSDLGLALNLFPEH